MMNEIATAIREVGAALMEREGTNVDRYASLMREQLRCHQEGSKLLIEQHVLLQKEIEKLRIRPNYKLPDYNGVNISFDEWEECVKEVVKVNDWNLNMLLLYLPLCLKEKAKESYSSLKPEEKVTKEALFQALRLKLDPEAKSRNLELFMEAKILDGESMNTFIDRCRKYVRLSGGSPTEKFAEEQLKSKVYSNVKAMDRKLLNAVVNSSDDLDKVIRVADSLISKSELQDPITKNMKPSLNKIKCKSDKGGHFNQNNGKDSPERNQKFLKPIGPCGKCHQWGHTGKYCPNKKGKP